MPNEVEAKITTAVLGVKIDHLSSKIDNIVAKMDKHMDHCAEYEKCIAVLKNDYENLDEKVDNMDDRYKKLNIATSVGAAVAFVLAALGFRPQ